MLIQFARLRCLLIEKSTRLFAARARSDSFYFIFINTDIPYDFPQQRIH